MSDHSNVQLFLKPIGLWNDHHSDLMLSKQDLSIELYTTLYGMSYFIILKNVGEVFITCLCRQSIRPSCIINNKAQ